VFVSLFKNKFHYNNYIKFKSGSGDGVYSLFRFVKRGMEHGETLDDGTIDYFDNTDESIGGLIFLDWVKNGDKILHLRVSPNIEKRLKIPGLISDQDPIFIQLH
jgi:hypothetical protein